MDQKTSSASAVQLLQPAARYSPSHRCGRRCTFSRKSHFNRGGWGRRGERALNHSGFSTTSSSAFQRLCLMKTWIDTSEEFIWPIHEKKTQEENILRHGWMNFLASQISHCAHHYSSRPLLGFTVMNSNEDERRAVALIFPDVSFFYRSVLENVLWKHLK